MTTAVLLMPLGVVLLNVYALTLVLLRAPVFGTRLYRPMVLNVALSVAPAVVMLLVLLAELTVVRRVPYPASTWTLWALIVVGGLVWLLLLPNAGYLVTELNFSHRRRDDPVPLWYDIVLVLSLAMSGVLNTLANVLLAQLAIAVLTRPNDNDLFDRADTWVVAGVAFVLVAVGIYLGRYVRFNSWDLLHPSSFVRKLARHFHDRSRLRAAAGFVLVHAGFFGILYLVVVAPAAVALAGA
jgi:uncharacterized membrane protein